MTALEAAVEHAAGEGDGPVLLTVFLRDDYGPATGVHVESDDEHVHLFVDGCKHLFLPVVEIVAVGIGEGFDEDEGEEDEED